MCVLSAEDLAILHRTHPRRVPAVKEATGDLERMRCDRTLAGPTLAILSGDDDLTVAMMQDPRIQASGVISVMSNLAPGAVHRLVAAQSACDRSESAHWAQVLAPLFRLVTCRSRAVRQVGGGKVSVEDRYRNPVPVKTMMAGLGIPCGPCRRPLGKMERAGVETCRAALREVFRADPESLRPIDRFFGVNVEGRLADDSVWAALTRS
jgi:4-hydroxy-tetrahydrodipicolinate synthase